MKTAPTSPSRQRKSRFSLRSRKKKAGLIQGKLRIRSMPGAFLVLGLVVVVVGTALAVAGYWPYRAASRSPLREAGGGGGGGGGGGWEGGDPSEPQASGWGLGTKSLLSASGPAHSDRMKLLGPVVMGVGLFILICANTVLYENRDRETQMLLAQMRSVICSVSAAVPAADLADLAAGSASSPARYQWVSSLPAAHINILCLQQLASSEPLLRSRETPAPGAGQGADGAVHQQAAVLHHQESGSSTPSTLYSSGADLDASGCKPASRHPPALAVSRGDGPVWASSMSTLGGDDWEGAYVAQPRRCHSMSYRTNPLGDHRRAPLAAARREASQHSCVNTNSLCEALVPSDLASAEERSRRSWPRLDLGCGRRYLKLENKEDSVDRLLDQMEQQCSQWDRSFGSGPFQ